MLFSMLCRIFHHVKNKTIIGLKYRTINNKPVQALVKNKTIIGLKLSSTMKVAETVTS